MNISIPVKDVSNQLLLRQHVGDGHCEGYDFTLSVGVPTFSPIVDVNGKVFLVDIRDIVQAVIITQSQKNNE